MNQLKNDLFGVEKEESFDFKEFFYKIAYRWWWFVISVLLCLGGAMYYYMSQTPRYRIDAKIMINDSKKGELGANAMVRELGFLGEDMFVENEIIELGSKNLMRNVVKELDLNVRYFREGRIREKEFYKDTPFRILIDYPENVRDTTFYVIIGENDRVKVSSLDDESIFEGGYSEGITMRGYSMSIEKDSLNKTKGRYRVNILSCTSATGIFHRKLDIGNIEKNTNAVRVSVEDELPARADDVIRKLIVMYNDGGVANKQIVSMNTLDFIDGRLKVISRELGEIEGKMERFKKQNRLTDLASDVTFVVDRKKLAGVELLKLETEFEVVKSIRGLLDRKGGAFHLLPVNLGLTDLALNGSIGRYNELILRRNKLLQTARPDNPLIRNMEALLGDLKDNIRETVLNEESVLDVKIRRREKESRLADESLVSVPNQEKQYRIISRQQRLKENLFLFLMQKREEVEIAKLMYVPMAKIIEDPNVLGGPVSPKKNLILLIGLVIGIVVPLGGIFVSDAWNTKIRDLEEVRKFIKAPLLGGLPELSKEKRNVFGESSLMLESMHLIRENLNYVMQEVKSPVVVVTSTISGEGKSFVSAHLANAYARSGRKTIVVGCDLRNPNMKEYFKCSVHGGLSAYLAGIERNREKIVNKVDDFLYVIFGGSVPPNPIQLISGARMKELLMELKKDFDCIILDSPPLGILAEGFALSRMADGCVYVVRANVLDRKDLKLVKELEKKKRLPNLGVVLNGIKIRIGTYGYNYSTKYDYESKTLDPNS